MRQCSTAHLTERVLSTTTYQPSRLARTTTPGAATSAKSRTAQGRSRTSDTRRAPGPPLQARRQVPPGPASASSARPCLGRRFACETGGTAGGVIHDQAIPSPSRVSGSSARHRRSPGGCGPHWSASGTCRLVLLRAVFTPVLVLAQYPRHPLHSERHDEDREGQPGAGTKYRCQVVVVDLAGGTQQNGPGCWESPPPCCRR